MADEGLERVRRAAERLLDRLEQAAEELDKGTVVLREKRKTEAGEEVFEITKAKRKGLVDRAGLKQLTGVLKDLQDILSRDGSLDARERAARLQKLEQEMGRSEAELKMLALEMNNCGSNYGKLAELTARQQEVQTKLEEMEERWLYLSEFEV